MGADGGAAGGGISAAAWAGLTSWALGCAARWWPESVTGTREKCGQSCAAGGWFLMLAIQWLANPRMESVGAVLSLQAAAVAVQWGRQFLRRGGLQMDCGGRFCCRLLGCLKILLCCGGMGSCSFLRARQAGAAVRALCCAVLCGAVCDNVAC